MKMFSMDSFIVVHRNDQVVKVIALDGKISKGTLRSAFLLEDNVPIGLFREDFALRCKDDVFDLLDDWKGAEFELKWKESRRSRPIQGPSNSKKQKIDPNHPIIPVDGDLARSIQKYALYYTGKKDNFKKCAIPLSKRLIATFRHGENKEIKLGDNLLIHSSADKEFKISTRAVKILEELDIIIFESDGADFCTENLTFEPAQKGMPYLLMGFSILHNSTSHQSLSTGIISSDSNRNLRYTGSNGSFQLDSGGSVWSMNGELMGMQVEGNPAFPGRCFIVSSLSMLSIIQDLLPAEESDEEWNE